MFKSIYETTPCKFHVIESIIAQMEKTRALRYDTVRRVEHDGKSVNLPVYTLGADCVDDLLPFGQPMLLVWEGGNATELSKAGVVQNPKSKQLECVIDVRNFTKVRRDGTLEIVAPMDYDFKVIQGMLSYWWVAESPQDILGLGNLQITIYARWLATQIDRKLGLPPNLQAVLSVIAAYFYLCQFHDHKEVTEQDKIKMAKLIADAVGSTVETVLKIIDPIEPMFEVQDFVDVLKKHGGSARYEDFNVALLFSLMAGSWFGFNYKEVIAVAIEHPPTFTAMLFSVIQERGYRNTVLGKAAKDYARGGNDGTFMKNVIRMLYF